MSDGSNPTMGKAGKLPVLLLFRRRRLMSSNADGNPLIYGLKGLKKYSIYAPHERIMWNRARLLFQARGLPWHADAIVHVPSRYPVSFDLADRLSDWSGIPHLTTNFLRKRRNFEVLDAAKALPKSQVPKKLRREFFRQVDMLENAPPHNIFEMKEVTNMPVRRLLEPWEHLGPKLPAGARSVVLVDDLMGSGATLEGNARALGMIGANVVGGVCLLSDLSRG